MRVRGFSVAFYARSQRLARPGAELLLWGRNLFSRVNIPKEFFSAETFFPGVTFGERSEPSLYGVGKETSCCHADVQTSKASECCYASTVM